MLIIIISSSNLKLGHGVSKYRSLGQIIKKHCVRSRGHSFNPSSRNFVRLLIIIISKSVLKLGHVGSKTRSLGQILETPCVHSRGHRFDSDFMKLCQQVNHRNVQVKLETGSCWVKN